MTWNLQHLVAVLLLNFSPIGKSYLHSFSTQYSVSFNPKYLAYIVAVQ